MDFAELKAAARAPLAWRAADAARPAATVPMPLPRNNRALWRLTLPLASKVLGARAEDWSLVSRSAQQSRQGPHSPTTAKLWAQVGAATFLTDDEKRDLGLTGCLEHS
jgi:hypothetical protein